MIRLLPVLLAGCWLTPAEIDAKLGPSETGDTDSDTDPAGLELDDLVGGDLVITEVMRNPATVADEFGEWFEIVSALDEPVDLRGLVVEDDDGEQFVVTESLPIGPGERLVFGRSGDTDENGGVTVDWVWAGLTLGNSVDELILANDEVSIDRVTWSDSSPGVLGASMSLDPDRTDAVDNDADSAWCNGSRLYGSGDLGTPGSENSACP